MDHSPSRKTSQAFDRQIKAASPLFLRYFFILQRRILSRTSARQSRWETAFRVLFFSQAMLFEPSQKPAQE
jgi:hypothetical protein